MKEKVFFWEGSSLFMTIKHVMTRRSFLSCWQDNIISTPGSQWHRLSLSISLGMQPTHQSRDAKMQIDLALSKNNLIKIVTFAFHGRPKKFTMRPLWKRLDLNQATHTTQSKFGRGTWSLVRLPPPCQPSKLLCTTLVTNFTKPYTNLDSTEPYYESLWQCIAMEDLISWASI